MVVCLGIFFLIIIKYIKEAKKLFEYYRPIEIDEKMDEIVRNRYMIEWWNKEIELFNKYGLNESIINKSFENINKIIFRDGCKKIFIKYKK